MTLCFKLPGVVGIRTVFVFGQTAADRADNHRNDCDTQPCTEHDQHKFHETSVAYQSKKTIPAIDSRPISANLATDRPNQAGIPAHVPLLPMPVLFEASEKEDPLWTTSHSQRVQQAAGSAFLSPQSLLSWFCFMRCSLAARLTPMRTLQPLARQKKLRQPSKAQRQRHPQPNKATHFGRTKGGCSDASAFGVSGVAVQTQYVRDLYAEHTFQFEVLPC